MTKVNLIASALVAAAAVVSMPSQAQERSVRPVLGAGVSFGGDTLATATFSDGSSEDISSGGLLHIYGGAEFRLTPQASVQATIGYHVDDTRGASNGSLRFSRYPLEVLGHFQLAPQFRLGAGARFVNNAKLAGSGVLGNINVKFDSTVGAVIEGEYFATPNIGFKLRAVSEKYQPSGTGASVDANHLGLYMTWYP
jgi:hypothetical protein